MIQLTKRQWWIQFGSLHFYEKIDNHQARGNFFACSGKSLKIHNCTPKFCSQLSSNISCSQNICAKKHQNLVLCRINFILIFNGYPNHINIFPNNNVRQWLSCDQAAGYQILPCISLGKYFQIISNIVKNTFIFLHLMKKVWQKFIWGKKKVNLRRIATNFNFLHLNQL